MFLYQLLFCLHTPQKEKVDLKVPTKSGTSSTRRPFPTVPWSSFPLHEAPHLALSAPPGKQVTDIGVYRLLTMKIMK